MPAKTAVKWRDGIRSDSNTALSGFTGTSGTTKLFELDGQDDYVSSSFTKKNITQSYFSLCYSCGQRNEDTESEMMLASYNKLKIKLMCFLLYPKSQKKT